MSRAFGAVLLQEYDCMLFPISYASKVLSTTQQGYSAIVLENYLGGSEVLPVFIQQGVCYPNGSFPTAVSQFG